MADTITRSDLADSIYNELGFSHSESLKLVDSVLDNMITAMTTDKSLKLSGFASFIQHKKTQRIGRNPRTGEEHVITARKVISFKASHLLKNALLGN